MDRVHADIAQRLQRTIAGWKADVTAAQEDLTNQIAAATGQLDMLTAILAEKAGSAGLDGNRLRTVIGEWKSEVVGAHNVLCGKIADAANKLDTLAGILARKASAPASTGAQQAIPALDGELTAAREALAAANNEVAQLRAAVSAQSDRYGLLEAEHLALTEEVERVRAEFTGVAAELDKARDRFRTLEEALDARPAPEALAQLEQTVADLRDGIEAHQAGEAQAKALAEQLVAERDFLRGDVASRSAQLAAAAARITELAQALDARPTPEAAAQFEQTIANLEGDLAAYAASEAEARAEIERLRDALSAHDTPQEAVSRETAGPSDTVTQLQEELESLRTQNDANEDLLDEARTEIKSLRQAVESLEAVCSATRAANEALNEEAEELRAESDAAGEALKEARAAIDTLKATVAERDRTALVATQNIVQLGQAVTRLEDDVRRAGEREAEIDTLRSELEGTSAALRQAHAEIESLRQALSARTDTGEAAAQHLAQMLHDRAGLEQETLTLTAEIETLRESKQRLESQIRAVETEKDAIKRQHRIALAALNAEGRPRKMGEILLGAEILREDQLQEALGEQGDLPDRLLGTILLEKGYVDEHDVAQVVASQLQVPFLSLNEETVSPEASGLLNGTFCALHVCVPLRATTDLLVVAMANPLDTAAVEKIEASTTRRVVPVIATPSEITAVIERLFGAY